MKVIWQSEIDPYCCKVLRKHWPEVPNHGDIKQINWATVQRPDVICGGYPCQPFSQAGKRQGENDPRHLWPWVREAICHLRPKYAILENVRGHLSLGFDTVLGEMAAIGYDARWDCIPAAAVGAPHLRDRVFIIARPSRTEQPELMAHSNHAGSRDALFARWNAPWHGNAFVADTNDSRSGTPECQMDNQQPSHCVQWQHAQHESCRCGDALANSDCEQLGVDRSPTNIATECPIWDDHGSRKTCNDFGQWWKTEPTVGRVADGIPNRVDRLRGLGNAVVPQVAEYIGRLVFANQ